MQDFLQGLSQAASYLWSLAVTYPHLATFLVIGLVAGWIAGMLLGGGGLLRNLVVGVVGAFVGAYVLQVMNVHFGLPTIAEQIATATVGALLVVVAARVIAR